MFEKEAEEYANRFWGNKESLDRACTIDNFKDGAEFGYNKGKAETALLSQHILELQKDKGNLTDRVRELEQQIEKMKCCHNCDFYDFRFIDCYYDKECKNKDHWKLRR